MRTLDLIVYMKIVMHKASCNCQLSSRRRGKFGRQVLLCSALHKGHAKKKSLVMSKEISGSG